MYLLSPKTLAILRIVGGVLLVAGLAALAVEELVWLGFTLTTVGLVCLGVAYWSAKRSEQSPVRKSYISLRSLGIFLVIFGLLGMVATAYVANLFGRSSVVLGIFFLLSYWGATRGWRFFPIVPIVVGLFASGYVFSAGMSKSHYAILARQAEARNNLGMIWVREQEFLQKHKRYGTFEEIGFVLGSKTNRYTYRIDVSGKPGTMIPAGIGPVTPDNTVVSAAISSDGQHFTATATANIDADATIDQWHVNDAKCCLDRADVSDVQLR